MRAGSSHPAGHERRVGRSVVRWCEDPSDDRLSAGGAALTIGWVDPSSARDAPPPGGSRDRALTGAHGGPGATRPLSYARITACSRLGMASLFKTALTCVLTWTPRPGAQRRSERSRDAARSRQDAALPSSAERARSARSRPRRRPSRTRCPITGTAKGRARLDPALGAWPTRRVGLHRGVHDVNARRPRGVEKALHVLHGADLFDDVLEVRPSLPSLRDEVVLRVDDDQRCVFAWMDAWGASLMRCAGQQIGLQPPERAG